MYTTEPGPSLGEDTSRDSVGGATDFIEGAIWRGGLIILGVVVMIPP